MGDWQWWIKSVISGIAVVGSFAFTFTVHAAEQETFPDSNTKLPVGTEIHYELTGNGKPCLPQKATFGCSCSPSRIRLACARLVRVVSSLIL